MRAWGPSSQRIQLSPPPSEPGMDARGRLLLGVFLGAVAICAGGGELRTQSVAVSPWQQNVFVRSDAAGPAVRPPIARPADAPELLVPNAVTDWNPPVCAAPAMMGQALSPIPSDDYSTYTEGGCEDCLAEYETQDWQNPDCVWARDLSVFAGIQGFKGPVDQGRNGNFGIHEGLNFGAPLFGIFDFGYQVGLEMAESNFSGDQVLGNLRQSDRNQLFFTGGLFHR